jgi:hypothetical protein
MKLHQFACLVQALHVVANAKAGAASGPVPTLQEQEQSMSSLVFEPPGPDRRRTHSPAAQQRQGCSWRSSTGSDTTDESTSILRKLSCMLRWSTGAAVVALAVAGCGGGGGGDGNVTPTAPASAQLNPVQAFALAQQSLDAPDTPAPTPATSANMIANAGFESGMTDWVDWGSTSVASGQASSGTSALRVGPAAGGAGQLVSGIVPGNTYRLTAQAKVSSASETVYIGVNFVDDQGIPFTQNSVLVTSTDFTTASLDVVAPPSAVNALVYVWKNAGSGLASVDDFTFADAGRTAPQLASSGNMLVNGQFESGPAGWVDWGNTNISRFAQVGPGAGGFGQAVSGIVAGNRYRVSALAKVSTAGEIGYLGVMFTDDAGNGLLAQNVVFRSTTTFPRVQTDVTAPAGATRALVFVWKNAGGGTAIVNDLALVQVAPAAASGGPSVLAVVNTTNSAVAVLNTGTRVAAWGDDRGVHAQRFDANGGPVGSALLIAPSGTFNGVAALAGGGYVVEYSQPGAVLVQIVSAAGDLAGQPVIVRTQAQVEAAAATTGQLDPKLDGGIGVYPLGGGGFVALYVESHLVHMPYDYPTERLGQRFDASGNAVGAQRGFAAEGFVASTPTGGLISGGPWLTWTPNGYRALVNVVDADLHGLAGYVSPFGEFTSSQGGAGLRNGSYIAIWTSGTAVRGQLFAPEAGSPSTSRILGPVMTFTNASRGARVTGLAGGGFLLSWGNSAQAFDENAQPVGGVMQILPGSIAATPDGGFVVVAQVGSKLVEQEYAVGH